VLVLINCQQVFADFVACIVMRDMRMLQGCTITADETTRFKPFQQLAALLPLHLAAAGQSVP
jgi:hypothetical protein